MDYNILFQLTNILQSNDYRKLLTEFNNLLSSYIPFTDSTTYIFDNYSDSISEIYQVKSFRYKKGRLYDDVISFDNFENSLLEYLYINKETVVLKKDLDKYKDFFKNEYFSELSYELVIGIPLINGLQVYGGIIIKFNKIEELAVMLLELAIEMLNSKLIMLDKNKKELDTLALLNKVVDNENVILYDTLKLKDFDEDLRLLIKGNHVTLNKTNKESCIFSIKNKVYRQVLLNNNGYLIDISKEINTHRKVIKDVYYDKEKKLFNKNKLLDDINNSDSFTLLKISYDNTYYLDVKKVVLDMFSNNQVYHVKKDIIIISNEVDKRKLNKVIKLLENNLKTIITLSYNLGVLIYPKDINNKDTLLDILNSITLSKDIFYDKHIHFKKENETVKKINIINAIKDNRIDLIFYPIYDLEKKLKAFHVKISNFQEEINDKRLELKLLKLIINRVNTKSNYDFIIDVSAKLINNFETKFFFDELNITKNICLSLESYNDIFIKEIKRKKLKVAFRGNVDEFFINKLRVDYFMTSCVYDDDSNPYLDMLGRMEGLGITKPVFFISTIDDFNYLLENQVGYFLTNKFIDEADMEKLSFEL